MKPTLFVANWKMQKSYDEATRFFAHDTAHLRALAGSSHVEIVLCPSFVSLPAAQSYLSQTPVRYGAQDCSAHARGAYTGEVSAQSLAELGCRYGIVGHSERRNYHHEDNDLIAQKAQRLLEHKITPIICIGESHVEYQQKRALEVVTRQLEPITLLRAPGNNDGANICIAYEPLWSVGTGIVPTPQELRPLFEHLHTLCARSISRMSVCLLYGGSVVPENCVTLASVPYVDGFLIGGASLNFQTLKNIVSLVLSSKR